MNIRVGKQLGTTLFIVAFVLAGSLVFIRQALAAAGQIYISPASSSAQYGSTVSVNVRINPGGNVDTVSITATYDPAKLRYVSTDYSGSPFGTQVNANTTSNSVRFDAVDLSGTPVSADSQIAKLTFSVLSGTGTTSLSLSGSDAAYAANSTGPGLAGSTLSLSCPAGQSWANNTCTAPSSGSGGGSGNTGTGSGSGSTGSSGSGGAKPIATGSTSTVAVKPVGTPATVVGKQIQFTKAVVNFATNVATQAYIRFGIGNQLTSTTPVSDYATSHSITLDPSLLVPGQTYSYVIVSTDQSGNVSQSAIQTFVTQGLKIRVRVVDSNNKPLTNKKVTLHSDPATTTTDSSGYASFDNVAPGLHHVLYTNGSKTYDKSVSVINDVVTNGETQTAELQNFSVVYDMTQSSLPAAWIWACVVILIIALLVVLGQTGRLGLAVRLRRDKSIPLVSQPIVVGSNHENQYKVENSKVEELPSAPQNPVDEHLSAIPDPNRPQPGVTVAPKNDEEPKDGEQ